MNSISHLFSRTNNFIFNNRIIFSETVNKTRVVALVIFLGLILLAYTALKCYAKKPPSTLSSEYFAVKKDLIKNRKMLDKDVINLERVVSTKLFLSVMQEGKGVMETAILSKIDQPAPHAIIADLIEERMDNLFDQVFANFKSYNHQRATDFKIALLLKDRGNTFSYLIGNAIADNGEISKAGLMIGTKALASPTYQQNLCELLQVPTTTHIDANHNFI